MSDVAVREFQMGAPTRGAFGEALAEAGEHDPRLVVVDGDVGNSTRTEMFGKRFPERFFQVGIAESNMVSVAAGLAMSGRQAVVSSFAAFLTCNAYDQIRMSVGFPRANVKLVGSHSGISIGEDGPSQMGIEDIALMSAIPGMTVVCPADGPSARCLTRAMLALEGPAYMRTGRPQVPLVYGDDCDLEVGRASVLRDGRDVTLVACGLMVSRSLQAADVLSADGIEARVIDMHTPKPLDVAAIVAAARETGAIVTAEEHLLAGGLGSAVAQAVASGAPCPMGFVAVRDTFAESGKPEELLEKYGLSVARIVEEARRAHARKG